MYQDLLKFALELNFVTYIDKSLTTQIILDTVEELRTMRESCEFQSNEEIYLRAFVSSFKQMIERKTYTVENVRYISGKLLEFLESMDNGDEDDEENEENNALVANTLVKE